MKLRSYEERNKNYGIELRTVLIPSTQHGGHGLRNGIGALHGNIRKKKEVRSKKQEEIYKIEDKF